MKFWLLCISSLIVGISVSTGYLLWTSTKVPKIEIQKVEEKEVSNEPISLLPPPKATLTGMIISLSGNISWQSRIATEASLITTTQKIQQGEMVITGEKSNILITFPQIGEITLASNSTLSFIQLFPTSFVLEQAQGSVRYSNTSPERISVRSHRILFSIQKGEAVITIDDDKRFITISVIKGSATAGYNDSEAISTVQTILKGESFTFDNEEKSGVFN